MCSSSISYFKCCHSFSHETTSETKCCFKLDKTPRETYKMLQAVCCDEALSHSCVFEQFKQFKDGREDLQDDPRSRRPSTSQNANTMTNICEMVIYEIVN
jgi:hypothetical protein